MLRKNLLPAWQKGFTLIELLVVIGIIGILITVVLVAINPGRQFAMARDTQRRSDLYSITNALYQYAAENDGNFPPSVEAIGALPVCVGTDANCIDLSSAATDPLDRLQPTYIPEVPIDPSGVGGGCTAVNTCYSIFVDSNERIVASASSEVNPALTIEIAR